MQSPGHYTSAATSASALETIITNSLNISDKDGPTCYIPACAYQPDSAGYRISITGALYVVAILWVLIWALPRSIRSMALTARQKGFDTASAPDEDECKTTSVHAMLSQRLVIEVCEDCDEKLTAELGDNARIFPASNTGQGCCGTTTVHAMVCQGVEVERCGECCEKAGAGGWKNVGRDEEKVSGTTT